MVRMPDTGKTQLQQLRVLGCMAQLEMLLIVPTQFPHLKLAVGLLGTANAGNPLTAGRPYGSLQPLVQALCSLVLAVRAEKHSRP